MIDEDTKKYEDPSDDGSVFHEDTTDYGIEEPKKEENPLDEVQEVFLKTHKSIHFISVLVMIMAILIMGIILFTFFNLMNR